MQLSDYIPLLVLFLFVLVVGAGFMILGVALGPRNPTATKLSAFETGSDPIGNARQRFSVKFYVVALLFIVFDIEAVFLYPWAVLFKDFVASGSGLFVLGEMFVFIGMLVVALAYVWRKGALEWEP